MCPVAPAPPLRRSGAPRELGWDHSRRISERITGWAQVNGRNSIDWDEKFNLDLWYVDNCTFWLDIKILFTTLKIVLLRQDISQEGEATMTKFNGTNK